MSENRLEGKNTIGTGDQKRTKSYKKNRMHAYSIFCTDKTQEETSGSF